MNNEEIKARVREAYGAAVQRQTGPTGRTAQTGCCGTLPRPLPAEIERTRPPGRVRRDSASDPGREARTSFGCGDPLAVAPIRSGQNVLDIGSGPGLDALAAARQVGPSGQVIGVDMTEAMIAKARDNAAAAGAANVEFLKGEAESLPLPDSWADWVISNCVVNLVPDKQAAFSEIFRVLKPGGSFSITDLVGENLPPEILADPASYCACIGGAPSEDGYLEAIRSAGFVAIQVEDRFEWQAPELEGTPGKVWSIRVTGQRPDLMA